MTSKLDEIVARALAAKFGGRWSHWLEHADVAIAAIPGSAPILWCMHVTGPDDIYACRDYDHARQWAQELNYTMLKRVFEDPSPLWPIVYAEPAIWPWDAASHAADLAKNEAARSRCQIRHHASPSQCSP
jgi:hypothetical protein